MLNYLLLALTITLVAACTPDVPDQPPPDTPIPHTTPTSAPPDMPIGDIDESLPACPSDNDLLAGFRLSAPSEYYTRLTLLPNGTFVQHEGRGRYLSSIHNYSNLDPLLFERLTRELHAYDWQTYQESIDTTRLSVSAPRRLVLGPQGLTIHIPSFDTLPPFLREALIAARGQESAIPCHRGNSHSS